MYRDSLNVLYGESNDWLARRRNGCRENLFISYIIVLFTRKGMTWLEGRRVEKIYHCLV